MRLNIEQITRISGAKLVQQAATPAVPLTQLTWDSRAVQPGSLFLALQGERHNGNDYLIPALDAGAAGVLASRLTTAAERAHAAAKGAAILEVANAQQALENLACGQRSLLGARVIGLTGSSGKTTTKDLVAAVAAQGFNTVATAGNHNNELGVPATILRADPDTQVLITEMGMRGIGQIAALCAIALPRIGIITNIGVAHLELLGSRENIARAKAELIEALPDNTGIAILNGDDPFTPFIRQVADTQGRSIAVYSYGLGRQNDLRAHNISYNDQGQARFDLCMPNASQTPVALALQGEHNVYNALAAATAGWVLGLDTPAIVQALQQAQGAPMRQETIITATGVQIINDTYNANPDSMRAALALLGRLSPERPHIAVLGDMLELGADELEQHYALGQLAAQSGLALLLTVGQRARLIAQGARDGGMSAASVVQCADVAQALHVLDPHSLSLLAQKPVVLVKASRSLELERVVQGVDEKC
ncbi:MAG: UDP-N-acetylmuramoyl-tripeptide--D-alanyl-D-alanine ligase [Coriobacteriales bacterium]|jgi:UDP-N-acetylmuramoyl-tripeptide--D-alanyl-D-alanine ligase|nr:UDP-N-acetylmuramoyl-tripeptide--D-alanyl-D-alanine ligase [Coriobacteriales bacterium]